MLFRETFVVNELVDEDLFQQAHKTLPLRLGVDSEALRVTQAEAEEIVELANRFLESIEALYPD